MINLYKQRNKSPRRRFWEKVKKTKKCWLWTGCQPGRPAFHFEGRMRNAAKVAYRWQYGEDSVTDDELLLSECENDMCIRPSHHYPGTKSERMLQTDSARNRRWTAGVIYRLMNYQWPDCQWPDCKEPIARIQKAEILPLCSSHRHRYRQAMRHNEYRRKRLLEEFGHETSKAA